MTDGAVDRKLVAVMFADIAGYTALMQHDEPKAREFIRTFNEVIRSTVAEFDGEVIQFYGDGSICVFSSSVRALKCSKKAQLAFQQSGMPVRIGVHSGDAYFDDNNVYGDSINLTSRIESIAVPGAVLFSERVKKDIKNQPDLKHQYLGPIEFKNIDEPVGIYALDTEGLIVPATIDPGGKVRSGSRQQKKWMSSGVTVMIAALVIVVAAGSNWDRIKNRFNSNRSDAGVKTVAVLDFESNGGIDELDVIASITTSRVVHGITQHDLARVVTDEMVSTYQDVMKSSVVSLNYVDFLNQEMDVSEVFSGSVYAIGDELILECTVRNAETNELVKGLPTVKGSVSDPMPAIEEQRELILGYIAQTQDKELRLSLETQPPKYAAYKAFLTSKRQETNEDAEKYLLKAIELDSNYFEPKVYLISNYYNQDRYHEADSLLEAIVEYFPDAIPRQQNIINFYEALLSGQNNIAYQCMRSELEYAPFDLPTNQTVMVLGTSHTRNLDEALEVYNYVDDTKLNIAGCDPCQIRMYVKGYVELEQQKIDEGLESGLTLFRNSAERWARDIVIRAYAMKGDWGSLDDFLVELATTDDSFDFADLNLRAAKESRIAGAPDRSKSYASVAVTEFDQPVDAGLIEALWLAGDTARAVELGQQYLADEPDSWRTMTILTAVSVLRADRNTEESMLRAFDQQRQDFQYGEIDYAIARAYSLAGDTDRALEYLESAIRQGKWNNYFQYQNDFAFSDMSDSARFRKICNYWTNPD